MPMHRMDSLIHGFVEGSKAILPNDLVGVYLHGSVAMGCFNPLKSDLDLIVVAERPLSDPVKRRRAGNGRSKTCRRNTVR